MSYEDLQRQERVVQTVLSSQQQIASTIQSYKQATHEPEAPQRLYDALHEINMQLTYEESKLFGMRIQHDFPGLLNAEGTM